MIDGRIGESIDDNGDIEIEVIFCFEIIGMVEELGVGDYFVIFIVIVIVN